MKAITFMPIVNNITRLVSSICLLLMLFLKPVLAVALESTEKVSKLNESFMNLLNKAKTEQAYSKVTPHIGVEKTQFFEASQQASQYMKKVTSSVGAPLSWAKISTQSITDHFYREVFLLKFESAAIVWSMTYYQPKDEWKLVGIDYSTNINHLFQPIK